MENQVTAKSDNSTSDGWVGCTIKCPKPQPVEQYVFWKIHVRRKYFAHASCQLIFRSRRQPVYFHMSTYPNVRSHQIVQVQNFVRIIHRKLMAVHPLQKVFADDCMVQLVHPDVLRQLALQLYNLSRAYQCRQHSRWFVLRIQAHLHLVRTHSCTSRFKRWMILFHRYAGNQDLQQPIHQHQAPKKGKFIHLTLPCTLMQQASLCTFSCTQRTK